MHPSHFTVNNHFPIQISTIYIAATPTLYSPQTQDVGLSRLAELWLALVKYMFQSPSELLQGFFPTCKAYADRNSSVKYATNFFFSLPNSHHLMWHKTCPVYAAVIFNFQCWVTKILRIFCFRTSVRVSPTQIFFFT